MFDCFLLPCVYSLGVKVPVVLEISLDLVWYDLLEQGNSGQKK